MTDTSHSFKPGDVANGHFLTDSGQWLPVGGGGGAPTGPGPKPKKPIWTRWWMIILYVFVAPDGHRRDDVRRQRPEDR